MQRVHKTINTKSRRICSVPQCTSYCADGISLHVFPLEPKLREKWRQTLRIGKPISQYMLVCSKHFLAEDFFYENEHTKCRRLKKGIVPSQKLPTINKLKSSKSTEKVMLFSQEDLLASDEYDKLLQVSCCEEEDEVVVDNEEEATEKMSQMPSGYDKLLKVKYEEKLKTDTNSLILPPPAVKRKRGRPRKKSLNEEQPQTNSKLNRTKNLDRDQECVIKNGNLARRGRPVGSKMIKPRKELISHKYYEIKDTSTGSYKGIFGTNLITSYLRQRPDWYVEFVDKSTQTISTKEKPMSKYIDSSTQTTLDIEQN